MTTENPKDDPLAVVRHYVEKPFGREALASQFILPLEERGMGLGTVKRASGLPLPENRAIGSFLQHVFGPHAANPNDVRSVKKLAAVYHAEDDLFSAPTIVQQLERAITDNHYIAFVGPRGGGKTALINQWLNTATKSFLEREARLAFFRIDATKVYDLKRRNDLGRDQPPTVENYFCIHAVYVFLQYAGLVAIKTSDDTSVQIGTSEQFLRVLNRMRETTDPRREAFIKSFQEYAVTVEQEAHRRAVAVRGPYDFATVNPGSEIAVRYLFREANHPLFDECKRFWGQLCEAFDATGVGILAIIDGVDNLSWSAENAEYVWMCEDTKKFIRAFEDIVPTVNRRLLLVSRPETIPELLVANKRPGSNSENDKVPDFVHIDLRMPRIQYVLSRKRRAVLHGDAFGIERRRCQESILSVEDKRDDAQTYKDMIAAFESHADKFCESLCRSLIGRFERIRDPAVRTLAGSISVDTLLPKVFDNNIRAVLFALLSAQHGRAEATRVNAYGADAEDRMLEYVLLGGSLFLDSRTADSRRRYDAPGGEVFPNILWYDGKDAIDQAIYWQGLAGVRILQLCKARLLAAGDVIAFLECAFNYSYNVLAEHIEAFVAFGLLDVEYKRNRGVVFAADDGDKYTKYNGFVRTSKKGELVLDLTFAHLDWLYHIALDTPLHQTEVASTSKVRFYAEPTPSRSTKEREDYILALVPTVATLLRHIAFYSKSELSKFSEDAIFQKVARKFMAQFRDVTDLQHVFALSRWILDDIPSQLGGILRRRLQGAQTAVDARLLLTDIRGAV